MSTEIDNYYNSLSLKEKVAFNIAKEHLGSLFDIIKTNGYMEWEKKQTKTKNK